MKTYSKKKRIPIQEGYHIFEAPNMGVVEKSNIGEFIVYDSEYIGMSDRATIIKYDSYEDYAKHELNEDIIGKFKSYKVFIWSNDEGHKPHCHIEGKQDGLDCCVRLDISDYFLHGTHKDKFTSPIRKAFSKFMASNMSDIGVSHWKYARRVWNNNNDLETKISLTIDMPDYSKLSVK